MNPWKQLREAERHQSSWSILGKGAIGRLLEERRRERQQQKQQALQLATIGLGGDDDRPYMAKYGKIRWVFEIV